MLFAIFALGLTFVYAVLGLLALLGYSPRRLEMFETLHFYAYLAVFGLFMLDLVIRVLLHTLRKNVVPE